MGLVFTVAMESIPLCTGHSNPGTAVPCARQLLLQGGPGGILMHVPPLCFHPSDTPGIPEQEHRNSCALALPMPGAAGPERLLQVDLMVVGTTPNSSNIIWHPNYLLSCLPCCNFVSQPQG